jgi:hypothetical protein
VLFAGEPVPGLWVDGDAGEGVEVTGVVVCPAAGVFADPAGAPVADAGAPTVADAAASDVSEARVESFAAAAAALAAEQAADVVASADGHAEVSARAAAEPRPTSNATIANTQPQAVCRGWNNGRTDRASLNTPCPLHSASG